MLCMADSNRYTCVKCSAVFRLDRWAECSNCGEQVPSELRQGLEKENNRKVENWKSLLDLPEETRAKTSYERQTLKSSTIQSTYTVSDDARAIVSAQNKTTYAIRSLALYFFISLQTGLIGLGVVLLFPEWAFAGAMIILGGFLSAVWYGSKELGKSRL